MTRLPANPQPIAMTLSSQRRPLRLRWGQHSFVIEQVTDEWQVETDWWLDGGVQHRHYFTVTTAQGALFVIYQDLLADQWSMEQIYDCLNDKFLFTAKSAKIRKGFACNLCAPWRSWR